jgi:crossover junction endodeoxyribonuclease RuvC
MKRLVAIDPGLGGAIALLIDGVPAFVADMPTIFLRDNKRQIDCAALAALIGSLQPEAVAIEQVAAMPKQGVASVFSFGMSYGMVQGVAMALALPLHLVTPQRWKKHHGLIGSDKDAARALAIQRYPGIAAELRLKKDVDRADAVLLGAYLYQTTKGASS